MLERPLAKAVSFGGAPRRAPVLLHSAMSALGGSTGICADVSEATETQFAVKSDCKDARKQLRSDMS